jgi:DNA-binding MarR family transcriptional regulator
MEKMGLVSRRKGEQDKRQQIVSLTPKGKELENEAFAQVPASMGKQMSACPLKADDYQHLAQELDSIINTLKK